MEERGADAGAAMPGCGSTPLTLAAQGGHEAVVRFLVTCRTVRVDARTGNGSTALMLACQHGHLGVVRCLGEDGGADAGAVRASDGKTALILAVDKGADCLAMAHCLLRHGARSAINVVCGAGGTALSRAAVTGSATLIHVLLSNGADANVDGVAVSPLMLALSSGRDADVVLTLVDCGADCGNEAGYLALRLAVAKGSVNAVRTLLQRGADFKDRQDGGGFALILSALRLHPEPEILAALLKHGGGCDMRKLDSTSFVLLMASLQGKASSIQLLCTHGADPNAALVSDFVPCLPPLPVPGASADSTPLMLAAHSGSMEAVLALLKLGARPLTKDSAGRAASDYATNEEVRTHLLSLS